MSTNTPLANFSDLPSELRSLSETTYNPCIANLNDTEGTIKALRQTDPRVAPELHDAERINDLLFTVTATEWKPPLPAEYPNLNTIVIEYERYPDDGLPIHSDRCPCGRDEDRRQIRERYLAIMFSNLRRLVTWFKEANNNRPLNQLNVKFRGVRSRDPRWYSQRFTYVRDPFGYEGCESCGHGAAPRIKEYFTTLATRELSPAGKRVSVVETLLRPLREFPIVQNFDLCAFEGLTDDYDLEELEIEPGFDDDHMRELKATWEDWMEGERDVDWRKQFTRNLQRRRRLEGKIQENR